LDVRFVPKAEVAIINKLLSFKACRFVVQLAQEAIERAVFQHQDDDVVDFLQLSHILWLVPVWGLRLHQGYPDWASRL
jgi:hypothetical protein